MEIKIKIKSEHYSDKSKYKIFVNKKYIGYVLFSHINIQKQDHKYCLEYTPKIKKLLKIIGFKSLKEFGQCLRKRK